MELEHVDISPHQFFTEGALCLHSSGIAAVDYFDDVSATYSTNDGDPMSTIENQAVVPEAQIFLETAPFERLKEAIDTLQQSDN